MVGVGANFIDFIKIQRHIERPIKILSYDSHFMEKKKKSSFSAVYLFIIDNIFDYFLPSFYHRNTSLLVSQSLFFNL